jgi:ABC-2 type transport system ATP-binding protein
MKRGTLKAVEAEDLGKRFGALEALKGFNLDVGQGEIFGLLGPDGAGKTTALRLLASVMKPSCGDAWIMGYHVVRQASKVRENIGYMAQRFGLYPDLTVMENINFYADLYGVSGKARKEKIEELLDFSNLSPFTGRLAGHLSGGMKQKLSLVCALIHTPKVLLLDEPTSGVDPVSRREFWNIIYELARKEVTVVLSTCYMDEAERCNRIGLLHEGKLLAVGTPKELKGSLGGSVIEIRSSQARKLFAAIGKKMGEARLALWGDRVRIWSQRDPRLVMDEVASILMEAHLSWDYMDEVPPTLEEAFIGKIGSP